MIKINLLKALKESNQNTDDKENQGLAPKGFLEKLFPAKKAEDSLTAAFNEAPPMNPVALVMKVVIILAIVIGLFVYESINIPKLRSKLDEERLNLQKLTEYNNKASMAVAEIKKQQEYKTLIEKQIASLDGLSKVRLRYIKVLDLIQSNIPEKMWFTTLKSKENLLEVNGLAVSETEITQFLNAMGKSVFFSDVSMQSSEDVSSKDGDHRKLKKFHINLTLETNK